jgi:hypothetical protein
MLPTRSIVALAAYMYTEREILLTDFSESSSSGNEGGHTDAIASPALDHHTRETSGGAQKGGNTGDGARVAAEPSPRAGQRLAEDAMQNLAALDAVVQSLPEARFPGAHIGILFIIVAGMIHSSSPRK